MNFGEVLGRAWKILWKYKVLWLFGVLASCGGQSGGSSSNSRISMGESGNGAIPSNLEPYVAQFEAWGRQFESWGEQMLQLIVPLAILAAFLGLLVWAVGTIGNAGLIRGAALADQDVPSLSVGQLFSEGYRSFWRLILLDLCLLAVGLVVALVIVVPLALIGSAAGEAGVLALICLLPLACLMIPMGWLLSIYIIQVRQVIVNENLGVFPSLSRAWDLVRGHPGELVLMSLALFIGQIVAFLIIALPFAGVLGAYVFGNLLGVPGFQTLPSIGAIVASAVVYGLLALFLTGLVTTFTTTAWTLTYRRLSGLPGQAPTLPVPVTSPDAPAM